MDDLYRDYILEHYRRPHNFGILEDPDARFEGANPLCGDRITVMLGIRDGVVAEVAFTGRGCAISQASASLLTDEIKGKPAIVDVPAGRGRVLLFATNPCYRWQNHGEFGMLWNALLNWNDLPPPAAPPAETPSK